MTPARDINTVCTHADLISELGSARALDRISPDADDVPDSSDRTKTIRISIYGEILDLLAAEVPPIHESSIDNPASLKKPVAYGTLAQLYLLAITVEDDVHHIKHKHWKAKYDDACRSLRLNIDGGYSVSTGAIEIERG
jgi:hypothetical protein